jgi:hypothetical protein
MREAGHEPGSTRASPIPAPAEAKLLFAELQSETHCVWREAEKVLTAASSLSGGQPDVTFTPNDRLDWMFPATCRPADPRSSQTANLEQEKIFWEVG